ncbi:MAG: SDR family NAD(P)-dependent oxidoreductase [Candidatus Geothermincolia bacterium]
MLGHSAIKTPVKTAVVTGAASGIGRSYALALAGRGFRVGIVDIDAVGAAETLRLLEGAGGSGEVYECDVRDAAAVSETAAHFGQAWGGVGVLVNNAGVAVWGEADAISPEEWRREIETNLLGVAYGCSAFIPLMKRQGGGHIINTASIAGVLSARGMAPYNATKAAVISLSETLRWELVTHGIGVTAVCPGFVATGLWGATASCSDRWVWDWSKACMKTARLTTDEIAERALRAAERGKLYVFTHPFSRMLWRVKRLSPGAFHRLFALLGKTRLDEPLLNLLARFGII